MPRSAADGAGTPGARWAGRADRRARPVTPAKAPSVEIGPFRVADRGYRALVSDLVTGSIATAVGARLRQQPPGSTAAAPRRASDRPFIAYALHVGGLNSRQDHDFVQAMTTADAVYADGASVVLLAKLAQGRRIERSGTTDLAWDVLRELGVTLGRAPLVALIGGAPGLAKQAGEVLEDVAGVEIVSAEHGYHEDWLPVLERVRASDADVVIVGLGAPREMKWVHEYRDELPHSLVMTCGGWFGFVVAAEKRAPVWMQRAGLEWSYRLAQAPGRLLGRYAQGAVTTMRLALLVGAQRARQPAPPAP